MTGTTAAIAIIAIVGGLLYSAYELNINAKLKRQNADDNDDLQKELKELKQEMLALKERTAVLEKIVTTENYDLKDKINSL
ncbi:MAG: hypothetical protein ACJAZB_000714 [Psychrosphaera sp.]|jgi:uncharacterized protein YigA (DUF484 family)|uniref:hypothetical protein n=1 Tax=Psychrosphaera sp. F3M07 TaxID=2841560 RepID=UPI001C0A2C84|nr:hypothetical protein [Psychrosphaera sp. F3M07]MBU2916855.1 hypothetical protein [Psychrosphaera sp. F3M07]